MDVALEPPLQAAQHMPEPAAEQPEAPQEQQPAPDQAQDALPSSSGLPEGSQQHQGSVESPGGSGREPWADPHGGEAGDEPGQQGPGPAAFGITEVQSLGDLEPLGAGPKYKRGRGRSFFKEQPKKGAVCQVPGCDRSLHKLRDYYKRYKICPYHLELPCLVVEGQTIRFCQQCGRFQLLSDFEGDRRSCRRKLDKHNERRRKAEAEQKARMMDSGSDSPVSGRGPKAHRVSPHRGGKGYANHANLMFGGGMPGDLSERLRQLGGDPGLADLPLGLLQTLQEPPSLGGMDWLAAGSLTNLAAGGVPGAGLQPPPIPMQPMAMQGMHAVPPPPPPLPVNTQAALQDVQQQVLQQGPGVLNNALVTQLQQLQQQMAPAPPPAAPAPQRSFFGSLFGGAPAAPPQQQPAGFGAAPTVPLQQQQQQPAGFGAAPTVPLQQQQQPGFGGAPLPPLPPAPVLQSQPMLFQPAPPPQPQQQPAAEAPASVFLQMQQQQAAAAAAAGPSAPQAQAAVPLLKSEPVRPPPGAAQPQPAAARPPPAQPMANGAAAVASLARAEGQDKAALLVALAKSVGVSSEELARALAEGGGSAAAAPANGVAPGPAQQGTESGGRGGGEASRDSMGSMGNAASSPQTAAPMQQDPQPGSVFQAVPGPAVAGPAGAPRTASDAAGLAAGGAPAAAPAAAAAAAGAGGAARQLLDMEQLQSAIQSAGVNPGFANDASLLLQLVAAVEAAQQQATPGRDRMHNLSLKLFNCTPDALPENILRQLEQWMVQNKSLVEGATRPGCVQVSVSALLSGEEAAALRASFSSMLEQLGARGLAAAHTSLLASLDGQAALLDERKRALAALDLSASAGVVPSIASVRPLAATPAYDGPILVTGRNLGEPGDGLFCRQGGSYPTTEILGRGKLLRDSARSGDQHWVLLRVPGLKEGCYQLEAQRGAFVSMPQPFLVVDDEEAVRELRQLELPGCAVADGAELLSRLGAVLRFAAEHRAAAAHAGHQQGGAAAGGAPSGSGAGCSASQAAAGAEAEEPGLVARMAAAAQELAAACILHGWGAVLRLVLPAASLGASPAAALAGIEAHLCGIPALHAAALTGGARAVRALGAWAAATGARLSLDARLGGCLTPLHVAVLLRDPEPVAQALTELCPMGSAEHLWLSAGGGGVEDSPLGLACRLNKRGLLAALAAGGLPAAGALLAAQQLQDRAAAAAATAEEAEAVAAAAAAQQLLPQRSWLRVFGRGGKEVGLPAPLASPSSTLLPPGAKAAAPGKGPHGGLGGVGAGAGPAAPPSPHYVPYAAALPRRERLQHCKGGAGGAWAFGDADTEQRFRAWHSAKLAKMDSLAFALFGLLFCLVLAVSPLPLRQRLHLWLLATVSRAPLMLQPLLLLCPPVRLAYRRDGVLLGLHAAMFGLQYWAMHAQGTNWQALNTVLAAHPAGLWLLVGVFTLQLRFAMQVPALLLAYAANVLLLPGACARRLADSGGSVRACVLVGGLRMFAIAVVLPLLAVRLLEARARSTFAGLQQARRARLHAHEA